MWSSLSTTLVLVVLLSGEVASDTSRCPSSSRDSGYLYDYGGKCYQFILQEKTWLDARSFCHTRGGAIASAKTSQKHQWLVGVLVNRLASVYDKKGFWLGLHDRNTESRWQWDEGPGKPDSAMSWSKWNPGEPNDITGQDCVYMRRNYQWRWVDVGCGDSWHIGRTYSFACEYEMDPLPTTTTTTPRPTTRPTTRPPTQPAVQTTTIRTTTVASTTVTPTTTPTTTAATTKASSADIVPPSLTGSQDQLSAISDISGSGAHVGRSSQGEESGSQQTGLTAGIISTLLVVIAILVIVLLFVKRRRDKKNLPPAHSLANPCYVDTTAGTNNLDREDNPYATCAEVGVLTNANVYVAMGDNPQVEFSEKNGALAFSNQRYMEPPLRRAADDIECADNTANDKRVNGGKSSKYLDECGAYTDDGYMQQKHIYADVSDIKVPAPSIVPNHYDIPEALGSSPPATNVNAYLYDEAENVAERSPSYSNIPAGNHYDIPKSSRDVAVEYADGAEATDSVVKDPQAVTAEGAHYDIPKYRLSDYVDTDAVYSL